MAQPLATLTAPPGDPAAIFEFFRGQYASELLTVAVCHFQLFDRLAAGPMAERDLQAALQLSDRAFVVLTCALRAMGLLQVDAQRRYAATPLAAEHLVTRQPFSVTGYLGLAAESPGVIEMAARLRSSRPAGVEPEQEGTAFIYRAGVESAMEREASARLLTLSLAGRARNVAPVLAARYPLEGKRRLLDVGGGSGIYSIAWLRRHPELTAIVLDRPEVLKVADEFACEFGVRDRLELLPGDMFAEPLTSDCDVILLSNVLHDWDVPECQRLVQRCADALPARGQLLIHDVFLHDELDGPLPIALYSAALFTLTEGRAYSAGEYRGWLTSAGLRPGEIVPTLIHCGVLPAVK